ncbi:type VII secretion protein EccCa [Corynebacterium sp.]|uniref:type VII secretion protein EccCa n=1 Tax=Corynebacterium sp. TaxID=1720 RepID=UPI0028ADDDA5|nr:type VII secretion protein EccCa [Corynebacterium sp.]
MHVVDPISSALRDPAPPLPAGSLDAEPVPQAARSQPLPLMRILMPLIMVVVMLGMVAMMVLSSNGAPNPMMLMFPLMMLASMAMMFNPQSANDPDESRRTYLRHLASLRDEALDNGESQRKHELHRHPAPEDLQALAGTARMWERAGGDEDAFEIRIGLGPAALVTPINVAESGAAEDLDPVCAVRLRHTLAAVSTVADMPVALQLQAFRFLGLAGDGAREVARAMVLQLAMFHGPETVGLRVIGEGWEWLKWLPHTRNPDAAGFVCLLVDDTPTTGVESFIDDAGVHCIIDIASRRTTALGVRAEQEGLLLLVDDGLRVVTAGGDEELGKPDMVSEEAAVTCARVLARFSRPEVTDTDTRVDLLSLLGFSDVSEMTGPALWPGRVGAARLAVPIGLSPSQTPVMIDLKESAQGGMGPHGLCIGATGSGKSEALRTIVLSLAATHSPDELNFVLVDFKGGATFLGCDYLPHTAAVITNLEDESSLVERMYEAISGEMNRRQEILRDAGNFANVTDYTIARLGGREDLAPLPALVIVVDEFSELLMQHPDFAELFVAVGRLGRSLHVHLLLASQRLEEGRLRGLDSHLSYRLGLKTFSAAESRQVLGVPDAYHLPGEPGAGYLKTDADVLSRFQAFYVSGGVVRETAPFAQDEESRMGIKEFNGWDEDFSSTITPDTYVDNSTTLLDEVVDATRAEALARGQSAHRVWLPPLPHAIELPAVAADFVPEEGVGIQVPIGIIDRPYYQRQDPLMVDLTSGHMALCGGPQSGKSTALRTIIASLAAAYSPEFLRFYVIDLGGGQLSALERLPHVAGVAGRHDDEKVRRIIDEVSGLVNFPEAHHTFLVIDGWHAIGTSGAEFEDLSEALTRLAADGPSAHVHVIISTPRWTTMRPAIRDLISERLELKLGEPMDSLFDRKKQQKLPSAPGRGITPAGEFFLFASTSRQDIAHIETSWSEAAPVPRLKMFPQQLTVADLEHSEVGIPWALGGRDLDTQYWDTRMNFVVIGTSGVGKSSLLATLLQGIAAKDRAEARIVLIDERRAHLGTIEQSMLAAYSATSAATEKAVRDTATTLKARLPGPDVTPTELAARSWWSGPDIYVVIDDLDLVSEMALAPLVELLPHARDIGLHIVVARKAGGIGRALFGQFLSNLRDTQPAVFVMDSPRDEGAMFGIKPANQPVGRGQLGIGGQLVGLSQAALPVLKEIENEAGNEG